ncbi:MAG: translation initiation factor IF-2 N-terminal domain-containing protein, partial [Lachnospiraceae bacterium]|nr:translation initiation factor IF-2 N-terminal domain-containing protein [Lachnospiraceae bacterium]
MAKYQIKDFTEKMKKNGVEVANKEVVDFLKAENVQGVVNHTSVIDEAAQKMILKKYAPHLLKKRPAPSEGDKKQPAVDAKQSSDKPKK